MWSGSRGSAKSKYRGWSGIGRQGVEAASTRKQRSDHSEWVGGLFPEKGGTTLFTSSLWVHKAIETEIGISSLKTILYKT